MSISLFTTTILPLTISFLLQDESGNIVIAGKAFLVTFRWRNIWNCPGGEQNSSAYPLEGEELIQCTILKKGK